MTFRLNGGYLTTRSPNLDLARTVSLSIYVSSQGNLEKNVRFVAQENRVVGICPRVLECQTILNPYIIYLVAGSVYSNPVAVYNLLFSVSSQCALSVVCLHLILISCI